MRLLRCGAHAYRLVRLLAVRRALKGLLNPLRDVSQLELCLCSTLWMGRIAISNFLIKIAVKRVVSRSVMRKSLPFVAIIGTAVWNALTARALMAEARVRAMGVSSASEIADLLLEHYVEGELSKLGKLQVVRAVACIVVQCVANRPLASLCLQQTACPVSALLVAQEAHTASEPPAPPSPSHAQIW